MTPRPVFQAEFERAVEALRGRLLADVMASRDNGQKRGGIRGEWRALVQRLAVLKNTHPPAPQTPAAR